MKLLIMYFSPAFYHYITLRSKYSPQHSVFKHFQLNKTELYHHSILNLVSHLFSL